MDVLLPLPVFPRPLKRASPPTSSRYRFSNQARTRSLTTPNNVLPPPTGSTTRSRRLTAPKTPVLNNNSPDPAAGGQGGQGAVHVVELAPMDEIDYLLHFLPAPLLPNLIEQLKRIDSSHRKLQELQDQRIRQARWTNQKLELEAIRRQAQAAKFSSAFNTSKTSPDLSLTPPTPIKPHHASQTYPTPQPRTDLLPSAQLIVPSSYSTPPPPPRPPLSARAPPFQPTFPNPKPKILGPPPTLKALFTSLRALSARLDDHLLLLPPSSPTTTPIEKEEETNLVLRELWDELGRLDTFAHGPKWKNWRRERTAFVVRLKEVTPSSAERGGGGMESKRSSLGSGETERTTIVLEMYSSPPRERPTGLRTGEGTGTPALSPSLSMSPSTSVVEGRGGGGGGEASMPATPALDARAGGGGDGEGHAMPEDRRERRKVGRSLEMTSSGEVGRA